jgi:hypothetical protein
VVDVPQQDWLAYEALTGPEDAKLLRQLTAQERFAIYNDLFKLVMTGRRGAGDWGRLDAWRWNEKVAHRQSLLTALTKLDQVRRERAAANDAR